MNYAAELDQNNIVIRVIRGTASWAVDNLGGIWVDSPKIGPGWQWIDGEFIPPIHNDDYAILEGES